MMSQPLVSIIIPCYNAEAFIAAAIQSALDQTYASVEVIVINDGSTDRSLDVIKAFGNRVRWQSELNRGGCAARNTGFQLSRGDYVKFLDADDLIDSEIVEAQVAAAAVQPSAIIYGPWKWLTTCGGVTTVVDSENQLLPGRDIILQWLSDHYCTPHSLLWPRAILITVGPWNEALIANQDGDLFIRAMLAGYPLHYTPHGMAYYRVDVHRFGSSVSSRRALDSLHSRIKVLDDLDTALKQRGQLTRYGCALGSAYCWLARTYCAVDNDELDKCFAKGLALTKGRVPGSPWHRVGVRILGIRRKERLAQWWNSLRST